MAKTSWRKGLPLEKTMLERLRDLVATAGEKKTAEAIDVSITTVIRAAAGLGLRRGTTRLIEIGLEGLPKKRERAA